MEYNTKDTLDAKGKVISTRVIAINPHGQTVYADVPVGWIAGVEKSVVVALVGARVVAIARAQTVAGGPAPAITNEAVEAIAIGAGATILSDSA